MINELVLKIALAQSEQGQTLKKTENLLCFISVERAKKIYFENPSRYGIWQVSFS